MSDISKTCLKCGAKRATGEMLEALVDNHPEGWPVYECGSKCDPKMFCNFRSIGCRNRELDAIAEAKG